MNMGYAYAIKKGSVKRTALCKNTLLRVFAKIKKICEKDDKCTRFFAERLQLENMLDPLQRRIAACSGFIGRSITF